LEQAHTDACHDPLLFLPATFSPAPAIIDVVDGFFPALLSSTLSLKAHPLMTSSGRTPRSFLDSPMLSAAIDQARPLSGSTSDTAPPAASAPSSWGRRLHAVRTAAGISQRELGVRAGLESSSASSRINRYELGVHEPDHRISRRLAVILGVPDAYFYAESDDLAALILLWGRIPDLAQQRLLSAAILAEQEARADPSTMERASLLRNS